MASVNERPHPGDLLTHAFALINERAGDYDNASNLEQNYREIAAVASVVIGKPLTPRDVAMIMVVIKLIRSKSSPDKIDNYVDAMNYTAFAACFAGLIPLSVLEGRTARPVAEPPKPSSNGAHPAP